MAREPNLGLDFVESSRSGKPVARVRVVYAMGYNRDGDPTLTPDCERVEDLERAVRLLVGDLEEALRDGRERLGEASTQAARTPDKVSASGPRPHLDSNLVVADVMTREVRTIRRNDRVSVGDELMRVGRFRHVVVLDDEGEVAGVLSQRDMMLNALSWHLGEGRHVHERMLESALAKDLMEAKVVTIAPDEPIGEAARRMAENKIGCLPVVDASGLVGIVTESDFLGLIAV
jgi:CBS domain-containing protein